MARQLFKPTKRWTQLRPHPIQQAYFNSKHRFNVVPSGRRSGKTELAKRKLVLRSIERILKPHPIFFGGRYGACAPTREQAKRIYWEHLKGLVPKKYLAGKPKETELIIPLKNDVEIHVIGMDKPMRIEGAPWDGLILDEYGNMKAEAWDANVRPALADREGWCDLIGVPEGRNHYYERYKKALADKSGEWGVFQWKSADILSAAEIESAKHSMDELTFLQEFEGSFVNFTGLAYYPYDANTHQKTLHYDPNQDLIFCFDFNVSPGVACVCQEQVIPGSFELVPDPERFGYGMQALALALKQGPDAFMRTPVYGTGVIGEVHIPNNSNTQAVVRRLIKDWGKHKGLIRCYGDATGGARGTAQVDGSDWDIIFKMLYRHFGNRVELCVPASNPPERVRVNSVNTRLKTLDGVVRMAFDPVCEFVIKDFEGVRTLEGGSGEIDKKRDKHLSHISDALGYYIVAEFPVLEETYEEMEVEGMY